MSEKFTVDEVGNMLKTWHHDMQISKQDNLKEYAQSAVPDNESQDWYEGYFHGIVRGATLFNSLAEEDCPDVPLLAMQGMLAASLRAMKKWMVLKGIEEMESNDV